MSKLRRFRMPLSTRPPKVINPKTVYQRSKESQKIRTQIKEETR